MKELLSFLGLLSLLFAVPCFAQTSNSLPFSAVTPPPPPALTTLGNLSTSGKIYTGQVMPINGTGFSATCVVNVDGTAQPAATFTFSSATLINFTVPASLGSSAGTSHTLTVTCPATALTMNNLSTLPNATVGRSYSANLVQLAQVQGGVPPYSFSLTSGSLPTGLNLLPSGNITGIPSLAGSSTFGFTVKDSSIILVNHSAALSWTASVSSVVGYNVYRSNTSGGPIRGSMAAFQSLRWATLTQL